MRSSDLSCRLLMPGEDNSGLMDRILKWRRQYYSIEFHTNTRTCGPLKRATGADSGLTQVKARRTLALMFVYWHQTKGGHKT